MHGFSRYNKYTLGTDLRDGARRVFGLVLGLPTIVAMPPLPRSERQLSSRGLWLVVAESASRRILAEWQRFAALQTHKQFPGTSGDISALNCETHRMLLHRPEVGREP